MTQVVVTTHYTISQWYIRPIKY